MADEQPHTVSALLIDPEGKLIIQLRDDKPTILYPNTWSTLGGAIEEGETPTQAMERELIEEIEICPPLHFWKVFDTHFMIGEMPITVSVHVFIGELDTPLEQINLHEGQRLGGFGADEIADLQCAFGLEELFKDFFANYEHRTSLHL
ncbi:MAG: NUDIX domain-containing protein [Anaerolineae bacterium]|nr:NUDIX domain-containing protein [Anaerolineae bacterium]